MCVEYGSEFVKTWSNRTTIFNQGHIFSIVPNSSPKSVWEGRVSTEHQDSHTIDFLDWWEKELEFVAIPSSIQDRATDTYTITIQFSDDSMSDVASHWKTMLPTFYDFDILFEDIVVYAGLEMHRANRCCYSELPRDHPIVSSHSPTSVRDFFFLNNTSTCPAWSGEWFGGVLAVRVEMFRP
jgi:hypothetical protein